MMLSTLETLYLLIPVITAVLAFKCIPIVCHRSLETLVAPGCELIRWLGQDWKLVLPDFQDYVVMSFCIPTPATILGCSSPGTDVGR